MKSFLVILKIGSPGIVGDIFQALSRAFQGSFLKFQGDNLFKKHSNITYVYDATRSIFFFYVLYYYIVLIIFFM